MHQFSLCTTCRDYVSNDDIAAMPIEQETAMFCGVAALRQTHAPLSYVSTSTESSFKCECCKVRTFGERHTYEAKPYVE